MSDLGEMPIVSKGVGQCCGRSLPRLVSFWLAFASPPPLPRQLQLQLARVRLLARGAPPPRMPALLTPPELTLAFHSIRHCTLEMDTPRCAAAAAPAAQQSVGGIVARQAHPASRDCLLVRAVTVSAKKRGQAKR
jgi:hypothetical protein